MTRSHHSFAGRSRQPPAIHIASSDGVTFKRVPPKSFVHPRILKAEAFRMTERRKDSAVHVSLSSSSLVKQPEVRKPLSLLREQLTHSTANDNRFKPAVDSLISVRSLQARTDALAEGQCSAALSGRVIGPPHRRCQRLMSTNRRIGSRFLSRRETLFF